MMQVASDSQSWGSQVKNVKEFSCERDYRKEKYISLRTAIFKIFVYYLQYHNTINNNRWIDNEYNIVYYI